MTALQWITKEAKSIRRKYPKRFETWREYVAKASAVYAKKHKPKKKAAPKKKASVKGLVGVSRKGKETTVHYTNKSVTGIGKIDATLKKQLSHAESALKKAEAEVKNVPQLKKLVAKLKKVVK